MLELIPLSRGEQKSHQGHVALSRQVCLKDFVIACIVKFSLLANISKLIDNYKKCAILGNCKGGCNPLGNEFRLNNKRSDITIFSYFYIASLYRALYNVHYFHTLTAEGVFRGSVSCSEAFHL